MSSPAPAAEVRGVRKRYGSVVALGGADLTVRSGEVHALLGENGAGKSTLLSVLGGLVRPDAGEVRIHGRAGVPATPREAWEAGIGLVHQHFTLVPAFTVLENLALGTDHGGGGFRLLLSRVRRRAEEVARRAELEVPLDAPVRTLGVGARQRTEILKVLLREPRVLALDEPTAVLAPPEVTRLLGLLRTLASEGRAVVLVAHKLDEVLAVADRVTVLRGGRTVLEARRDEVDAASLADAMVGTGAGEGAPAVTGAAPATPGGGGEEGSPAREDPPRRPGARVALLEGVEVRGPDGRPALRGVDLEVRRGEIVGVAGVEGNGQRELALVLAGRLAPDAGRVEVPRDPGFVPQDRGREGLVPDFDLVDNVALALHRDPAFLGPRGWTVDWPALRRRTEGMVEAYGVRAAGVDASARTLSGGNQQRLVVARELAHARGLLVAENPTRGLDVAGAAFVHRTLLALRAEGEGAGAPGIALISTDLDEVLALADRLFVAVRGRLLPVPPEGRSRREVGALMLSGR